MPAGTIPKRLLEAQRLEESGDVAAAAQLYGEILRADPEHAVAAHRLGLLAQRAGAPERAIRLLRQALRSGGETAELLNDLGKLYVDIGGWENAWRCFRRCIDRYPDSVLGYVSLAYVENARGNFEQAEAAYLSALGRVENPLEAQSNLAALYREWGQLERAAALYDELIRRHPQVASLVEGRARTLLQQKCWKRGWRDYEARFSVEGEPARINLELPIERWQGQPLDGKRLLILHEQGVGDEVQFASCFPDAIQRAEQCTVTCSPRLLPIFQRSFPRAAFIPVASAERETWAPEDPSQYDYFVPAGSLPRFFRRRGIDFLGEAYLRAGRPSSDGRRADSRLPRVGVSWWGGVRADQIQRRSIPLEIFQQILSVPGVQFVNLQHGCCDRQAVDALLGEFGNLETRTDLDPYRDLDAWFDLIASLDLVISVDNSNVHFAGALGVPTWLLLPDHPNWRWPQGDESSNWYSSVEFIRKPVRESWLPSVEEASRRLAEWRDAAEDCTQSLFGTPFILTPSHGRPGSSGVPLRGGLPRNHKSSPAVQSRRLAQSDGEQQTPGLNLPAYPRFLILRQSSLGDVVHALPVLNALRSRFPTAVIGWFVDERAVPLVQQHEALDEAIIAPPAWERSSEGIGAVRQRLREFQPDVTIDVQGLPKTALAGWLSAAPHRVGFAGSQARGASSRFTNVKAVADADHIIDQNLQLLRPLGIYQAAVEFRLPIPDATLYEVGQGLHEIQLQHRGFYLVNVGSSIPSRRWPARNFATVVRNMGARTGATAVVAWATADERLAAEEVVRGSAGSACLAPATDLLQFAALARYSAFCLSGDTGPLHIAAAVGTPCVSLHGPTNGKRTGPYGARHLIVQSRLAPHPVGNDRPQDTQAIEAIPPDDVAAVCETMWHRRGASHDNLCFSPAA